GRGGRSAPGRGGSWRGGSASSGGCGQPCPPRSWPRWRPRPGPAWWPRARRRVPWRSPSGSRSMRSWTPRPGCCPSRPGGRRRRVPMTPGVDDPHAPIARTRPAWTTRPEGRAPRARGPRSSLVLGVLVLAAVVRPRWVRLNLSPSVPLGVYRLEQLAPPLARGTLVVLSAPASIRPWWRSFASLLKPVAAVAGDEVCGVGGELFVQGEWFGPIYTE